MASHSAGLLLYRYQDGALQVFLVHPGGPFWKNKDDGSWMIPKGEIDDGEAPLPAAKREFAEETGFGLPAGPFLTLTDIKQSGGKTVTPFAAEGDCDPAQLKSNTFEMEWPPKSGRQQAFPEVDRGEWYNMQAAEQKILKSQRPILQELAERLASDR